MVTLRFRLLGFFGVSSRRLRDCNTSGAGLPAASEARMRFSSHWIGSLPVRLSACVSSRRMVLSFFGPIIAVSPNDPIGPGPGGPLSRALRRGQAAPLSLCPGERLGRPRPGKAWHQRSTQGFPRSQVRYGLQPAVPGADAVPRADVRAREPRSPQERSPPDWHRARRHRRKQSIDRLAASSPNRNELHLPGRKHDDTQRAPQNPGVARFQHPAQPSSALRG